MSRRGRKTYHLKPLPEPDRLRVGFVTPNLNCGGAERWILSLCRHMPRDRVEVAGIFTQGGGLLLEEATRLTAVYHMGGGWHPAMNRCDILVVWGISNLAETAAGFRGPIVAVSHGAPELEWAATNGRLMQPYATHLAAVSDDAARIFTDGRPVEIIHNGAEADRAAPRRGRDRMRQLLRIPERAPVLYYGGRISPEKRPQLVREVLDHLPPEWHAVIAGPNYVGMEIEPHPRLRLCGSFEVPGDYLAACDVFMLPSVTEGFGIAMLEAMLAGRNIVCCEWPVMAELREGYEIEVVTVPVDATIEQWAEAVQHANSPEWCWWDPATSNRIIAWEELTAGAMAENWTRYLSKCAEGRKSVAA